MEQPNYKDILKQKIDYYGKTEAAYEFAAEQYALLYHLWATQGAVLLKNKKTFAERLKEEMDKRNPK